MAMRPKNRGFSRKVFDLLETKGPMSRSTIAEEMRKMGHPVTSKQIITCLQNMRQRHWIEFSQDDRRKFDIRSETLRNQRDMQVEMLNQRGKVTIRPFTPTPIESPTPDVKTPETEELRPVETFTVPLPVQVVGMVLLTAIVTAVSTAIAMRMF